ncbi:hypothetical protein IWQ56_005635 [Coemansia nantahalensis]|nr:hypothetical protein IWQ56_005635 [Coemansia nantahalensis]
MPRASTSKAAAGADAGAERRPVPAAMAVDRQAHSAYRGKTIKESIERNRLSSVKRKYFKELERDARAAAPDSAPAQAPVRTPQRAEPRKSTQRANPYQKVVREREAAAKQREEERARRAAEIRQAAARRRDAVRQREKQRWKHNARTQRGQPLLSNQITSLLEKLQKDAP